MTRLHHHYYHLRPVQRTCRLALIALLLLSAQAPAQTITGRISGTVKDSSGGIIPGVSVTVTNEGTNIPRSVVTDEQGFYVMTSLPVGTYSVGAEQPGFRKMKRTGFNLNADGAVTCDFVLDPAGANEVVEVVAVTGETINTVTGEVGRVIDAQQVQNAALNGRNYLQLATLVPGAVVLDEDQLGQTTSLSLGGQTINGNRPNTNYLAVDGGSNMDSGSNNSQINNVGVDFIREISIKSSNFSAEFGRNSGSSVNVVTKGGEDKYHGGVFEFFRNEKLDARNYFAPIKGPLRYNDFGWNLGGPIKRKKLYFFAGEEWKIIRRVTDPVRRTIPTRAERAGDFTLRSGNLRYPGTTTPIPGRNVSSMITPDGQAITRVYDAMEALASSYTDTPTSNNVIHQMSNPFNWRQDIIRIDYRMNEQHSLYFRYLHDNYDLIEPYGTFFSSNLPMTPTKRLRPGYNYQISHTWIPAPRMVNEAKINSSWNGQRVPMVGDLWTRAKYGFQFPQMFGGGWYPEGAPNIDISNFANIRGPQQALMSPTTDIQILENFTWILRRHALKLGVTFIRNRKDQNGRSEYDGYAGFSTSGNSKTTGNAFADALLGNFRTYRESSADPVGFFRFSSWEGYLSDNWRVSSQLNLEIGVRWQRNVPTYTSANNITNFVPALYDPSKAVTVLPVGGTIVPGSGNVYNGLIRAGEGIPADQIGRVPGADSPAIQQIPAGAPRGLYDPQLLWAPRFSFAYRPFRRDNRTVIQGGFGIFYDKPEGNLIFPMVNYAPWLTSVIFENGNLGNPSGGTPAALAPMGNIDAVDPNLKTPYTMSWSFGLQREFARGAMKGMLVELKYVANVGRHLIRQPDINQVPFPVLVEINKLPSAQRPSTNSLRPFKGYSAIRQRISDSTSNYHSLQAFMTKRLGKLMFTASYTWSKALSDASSNTENPENPYDRHYSYGPSSVDRSHIFNSSYTYQIPMHQFENALLRGALKGWEVSGIVRLQTGNPLTITANTSTGTRRADYLGGDTLAPKEERGPDNYINAAAFQAAPDESRGNAGIGMVRGYGLHLWDFSLRKRFNLGRLHEGMRLQFQADVFNAFNRENFRSPVTNMDSAGFGTISTVGPPRNIQLALKLNF